MKKVLILFTLCLGFSFAFAQQIPRDKVIVEVATGTWCGYCPGAAMGADDLVANGHDVGVIEYHNGDPFTNPASNARNNYYNVSGYPTTHFDGVLEVVGGSPNQSMYPTFLPKYNQRIAIPSSFRVQIFGNNDQEDYNITLVLDKVAPSNASNLKVHLALTESEIPYSWQGMTEVNFVERMMIPDHNGTNINFDDQDQIILELDFILPDDYILEHCELVAFIQNNNTKEIMQGTMVKLNNLYTYIPPLQAGFEASDSTLCAGKIVQFNDLSGGEPTGWAWSFPGGTPDTSNEQHPVVEYKAPGDYDVMLQITRGFKKDTISKNNFIHVKGDQVIFNEVSTVPLDSPPLELTHGEPAGGIYEGPGVIDGWFYAEEVGMGEHTLMYIYEGVECSDTAYQTVLVDGYMGIGQMPEASIDVYPNPSNGLFSIKANNTSIFNAEVMIFNALGKQIKYSDGVNLDGSKILELDLSNQPTGIYYLRIKNNDYDTYRKLIIR